MGLTSLRSESSKKSNRKFEKKVEFYDKVREAVASLGVKKAISKPKKKLRSRHKKLKAYDLTTLSEFLPELKAPRQPPPPAKFKLNCKSRQKLVATESERLRMVLEHPVFQANPLEAIHQHLKSSQPVIVEKPDKKSRKDGKKKKSKGRKSKTSAGPQSMDM